MQVVKIRLEQHVAPGWATLELEDRLVDFVRCWATCGLGSSRYGVKRALIKGSLEVLTSDYTTESCR